MANRPQVNTDLGAPEQARVVARPVTPSAVPVYAPQMSRAGQLAEALSSVAPKLHDFIQGAKEEFQTSEAERAYDTIQGMTFEDAKKAVESGQIRDTESPWYQAAFEKQFGMAYAARRRQEIVDRYNNEFDKHSGDVDGFLAQFAQEDMDKFGGSKFIMSGYRDGMKGVLGKVRDDAAEFRSTWTKEKTVDNFGAIARSAIDTAAEAGDNPMEAVRALYADHKKTFGMSFGEMDAVVFNLAREYAEKGDVETVEAILNYEAVGEDGTKVGSFSARSKYSLDAQALTETAKANQAEARRAENTSAVVDLKTRAAEGALDDRDKTQLETLKADGQITQAQHESMLVQNENARTAQAGSAYVRQQTATVKNSALDLVTQGKGYTLQDVEFRDPYTGKTHTLRANDLVEEAANDALNTMAAKGATPQKMAAQLASWGVDFEYSVWENAMSNGYSALSESLATTGKDGKTELPEPALAGYGVWKALSDQPRLRDRHIKDETAANIYRDAEALERLGVPLEDALLRSAAIDRKSRSARSNALTRDQIESIVDASAGGMLSDGSVNGGAVSSWIEDMVRVQVDLGVSPKQAVKNGIKAFEDSHTVINGAAINTRNVYVPPNFAEASENMLEDFAEQAGEDADDLTLIPAHDGSNYWVVALKSDAAFPIPVKGRENRFHISQIQQASDDLVQLEQEREQALSDTAKEAAKLKGETRKAHQDIVQGKLNDFREWRTLSRKERKARGWPVSIAGAQNFFNPNSDLLAYDRQQAKAQRQRDAAERQKGRADLSGAEGADIYRDMGIRNPADR